MALQSITNINLDFVEPKYLMVNAKQHDDYSREIHISCYNDGEFYNLNNQEHTAFIKFKKPDGHFVFNLCEIEHGKIIVVLTKQMLAAAGICGAEIMVVNEGKAEIDADTGEIIVGGDSKLATMIFYVNVYETAVNNSLIESNDGFLELSDTVTLLTADLTSAVVHSKYWSDVSQSWAVGDLYDLTGVKGRENEGVDNAEYYSRLARSYTKGDLDGATNIVGRENEAKDNAKYYSQQSESWAIGGTKMRDGEDTNNSMYYGKLSKSYAVGGSGLEERNEEDTDNASFYKDVALTAVDNAKVWAEGGYLSSYPPNKVASTEETTGAKQYAKNSSDSANLSKSYAVGGTGIDGRESEDIDNAEYYSRLSKSYAIGNSDGDTGTRDNEGAENAKSYYDGAGIILTAIQKAEGRIEGYEASAQGFASAAEDSEKAAKTSETNAENSATSAATSAISANSDAQTSQYYAEQAIEAMNGVGSIFLPGGTISNIDELSAMLEMMLANGEPPLGYVYNIMEGFISDDRFMYTGRDYAPGTLVYYGVDGLLHCFEGFMVTGVKGDKESIYRMGSVNITAANVGAVATTDVATVSEMKNYLGI